MNLPKSPEIRAQYLKLQQVFHAGLPARIQAIEEKWAEFAGNRDDREIVETLHGLVHSLIGTSGTFGAADISASARELDNEFKAILAGTDPLSESTFELIARKYDHLVGLAKEWKPDEPPVE